MGDSPQQQAVGGARKGKEALEPSLTRGGTRTGGCVCLFPHIKVHIEMSGGDPYPPLVGKIYYNVTLGGGASQVQLGHGARLPSPGSTHCREPERPARVSVCPEDQVPYAVPKTHSSRQAAVLARGLVTPGAKRNGWAARGQ